MRSTAFTRGVSDSEDRKLRENFGQVCFTIECESGFNIVQMILRYNLSIDEEIIEIDYFIEILYIKIIYR